MSVINQGMDESPTGVECPSQEEDTYGQQSNGLRHTCPYPKPTIMDSLRKDSKNLITPNDSPSGSIRRDVVKTPLSEEKAGASDSELSQSVGDVDNEGKAAGMTETDGDTSMAFQRFDTKPEEQQTTLTRTRYKVQMKNSRYYFQHPYCRVLVAYIIVFFNFLIFAEDPVSHSVNEAELPVIGNNIGFLIFRYPPGGWAVLKVLILLIGIAVGMAIGKFIVHKRFLSGVLKLTMFQNCQGSWMIMFLTTLFSLFIFSYIFNGFLAAGSGLSAYKLSSYFGVSNGNFMKVAALGTWTGDFVTAWMVTDMMLQDRLYPSWSVWLRSVWRRKWFRIIAFWTVWFLATIIVATAIITDYLQWDSLNRDFVTTNELGRAFLAAIILVMDLLIVMQDWDFPHFQSDIDIKLPGVDTASFHVTPPRCLKKENWAVYVTGKWFNYGVIFIVMILDMNMWKNQIFYDPFTFGQYTDPEGHIYTVTNETFLKTANKTTLSYAWRWNNTNPLTNRSYGLEDPKMNSKYMGYSLGVKGIAFIPSLAAFLIFGLCVWFYGREKAVTVCDAPTEVDGVVVDKWEEEVSVHDPADEEADIRPDPVKDDVIDGEGKQSRPMSTAIVVESVDENNQPVLVNYERKSSP